MFQRNLPQMFALRHGTFAVIQVSTMLQRHRTVVSNFVPGNFGLLRRNPWQSLAEPRLKNTVAEERCVMKTMNTLCNCAPIKERSASDLCSSASKRSSFSSIARRQEMIALQLKQMELELETARAIARMEKFKLAMSSVAMSSVGCKSELKGQSRRCDVLANNDSGEPGCSKNIVSLLVSRAVDSKPTTVSTCAVTYSPASTTNLKQLLQQLMFLT